MPFGRHWWMRRSPRTPCGTERASLTADFNYGLFVIIQVAELVGYQMLSCQKVIDWYQKIKKPGYREFSYKEFGITDKGSFEKFYKM